MNNTDIKNYVESSTLVSRKLTNNPNLYILKYKKKVFYDNLWDEYLELCRGTVVDIDYNVISMPFRKIYNYGIESNSPVFTDDTVVTAMQKINGFMVSITWYNNNILVSTTGSIDSDFVNMAREFLTEHYYSACKEFPNYTFMFECCHPSDPHIITELYGLHLLGIQEHDWNSQII